MELKEALKKIPAGINPSDYPDAVAAILDEHQREIWEAISDLNRRLIDVERDDG